MTPRRPVDSSLPTGAAKVAAVDGMFDTIAPRYDLCNRLISLGLDQGWRRRTVAALELPAGAVVLDLACGTGDLCAAARRAGLVPVGADRSAGMLAAATVTVPLIRGDGLALPVRSGAFDGLVCGFALRNFAALEPALAECARVLRPGGRVAFLEVGNPQSPLLRAGNRLWFGRVVPAIGGLLSDRAAYRYLPRSVAYLPSPAELAAMMSSAGFDAVARRPLSGGLAQLITARRPS